MASAVFGTHRVSGLRSQDLSNDEIARLGAAILAKLCECLEASDSGRYIAIAVEDGDFRLGDTIIEADDALRPGHPEAVFYYARIGFPVAVCLAS